MSQVPATPDPQDQPLGLTVHGLPEAATAAASAPSTRLGRVKMLLILLVCASPVIASYFTYYVVRPEGRRNFGELIDPQRPMPALEARTLEGATLPLHSLKDQWLLVTVAGGACGDVCQQNLYFQRQMRESLGREKERLDRVWIVSDDAPVADSLRPALQGATVLRVPANQLAAWVQPAAGHDLQEHLFVVDPLGNLMMRFPPRLDLQAAGKAKRDLERLMRASNSWDKPGRP